MGEGKRNAAHAPKVGGLETGRASFADVECILEMLVEGVEQAVGEAPEEEEDGDEADWVERLLERQLGRLCPLLIRGAEGAALPEGFGEHLDLSPGGLCPSHNRYDQSLYVCSTMGDGRLTVVPSLSAQWNQCSSVGRGRHVGSVEKRSGSRGLKAKEEQ